MIANLCNPARGALNLYGKIKETRFLCHGNLKDKDVV